MVQSFQGKLKSQFSNSSNHIIILEFLPEFQMS